MRSEQKMACPSSPQHEPTMEEILASIRKIISEDSSEPQPAPSQPAAPAVTVEADVLELTHEIEDRPSPVPVPSVAPLAAAVPEPAQPTADVVFQSIEETPVSVAAQASAQPFEGFVSEKARHAVDEALSGLDFGPDVQSGPPSVAPIDGRTIEAVFDKAVRETFDPVLRAWLQEQADIIVERMKPVIREWLEDNLPSMLKSAVEAEVARAVRARSKR